MSISKEYRNTIMSLIKALPERLDGIFDSTSGDDIAKGQKCRVVDPEAFHEAPRTEAARLYHHLILLRDDIRYQRQYNGPGYTDLNRYVRSHYGKLHLRIRREFFRMGRPDWSKLESVERAGINVVYDKREDRLEIIFDGGSITV